MDTFGASWRDLPRHYGNRHQLYAAQTLTKGGGLIVDADLRDLPRYEDIIESPLVDLALADIALARYGRIPVPVEVYEREQVADLFASAAHWILGNKVYGLHYPENPVSKVHVGQYLENVGVKTVKPETSRRESQIVHVGSGQILGRTGTIKIDSSSKSSLADNELFFVERMDLTHGQTLLRNGLVTLPTVPQFKDTHRLTKIRVGSGLVRAGNITIN